MIMAIKKVKYIEPEDYIPKELRKEFGLGEYAEKKTVTKTDTKKDEKKAPVKKADTKKK